ncbi:MAG: hypothetical protein N2235_17560, partial [Fischerella sp.]|nr:hypothetical protein [Fischerella sp.]
QDIRVQIPDGSFHLEMCRNLVFTYFEQTLQREILQRMQQRLLPGGVLVIGSHETLPPDITHIQACPEDLGIYRLSANGTSTPPH